MQARCSPSAHALRGARSRSITPAEMGCRACASPGGGCQFLGTAATSQVVAEALGIALPHSALAPSGHAVWLDAARRSARALLSMHQSGLAMREILTSRAIENAMVVHAAFGGSTNLLLHVPPPSLMPQGLPRPTVEDWQRINRMVPRIVDALPNGPRGFATVQVFLAGGVPEAMLHLRRAGLLDTGVKTVTGQTLGENLDWWEQSRRRRELMGLLRAQDGAHDGIDPEDVIMPPERARQRGLTSTVCFPARQSCAGGFRSSRARRLILRSLMSAESIATAARRAFSLRRALRSRLSKTASSARAT